MALKVSISSVLSLFHVLSGLSSLVMAIPHPSAAPSLASAGLPSENMTDSYEPGDMRVRNMIQYENIKEFGEHIYYTVEEYSGEQSASKPTNYLCDIQLNRQTNWPLSVEADCQEIVFKNGKEAVERITRQIEDGERQLGPYEMGILAYKVANIQLKPRNRLATRITFQSQLSSSVYTQNSSVQLARTDDNLLWSEPVLVRSEHWLIAEIPESDSYVEKGALWQPPEDMMRRVHWS